jgi:hypothetical protein
VKRRTVLIAGVTVTATATAGAIALARAQRPSLSRLGEPARELGHAIFARLDMLDIAGEAYEAFLRDVEEHEGPIEPGRSATRELVGRFLLSTDFFLHGADETRRIAYHRYHDPYVSPCPRPFG